MTWSKLKSLGAVAVVVSVVLGARRFKPHSEEALLVDWSAPPPWPIFIAVNALAGALRSASDALTPPPIKMLDMAMGYHHTILVHVAQKFKIPDLLAKGPLSAAEIAAAVGSDARYIERIMYACAARRVSTGSQPARQQPPICQHRSFCRPACRPSQQHARHGGAQR